MLTAAMRKLIEDHTAGMVATVKDDGTPAVSPKATFVVLSDMRIAYGDIRSPGTAANLRARPAVEVCFIDVLARQAVRVKGTGTAVSKNQADADMTAAFERNWGPYVPLMSSFVVIDITAAEHIYSPGYDIGLTESELRQTNLAKLTALCGGG